MPKVKSVEMIEVDNTAHDLAQHTRSATPHSKAWYAFWNNVCPVCQEPADVEEVSA